MVEVEAAVALGPPMERNQWIWDPNLTARRWGSSRKAGPGGSKDRTGHTRRAAEVSCEASLGNFS